MTATNPNKFAAIDAASVVNAERTLLGLSDTETGAALCLSGGGIRSAAFCLGVIQALVARDLLHQFHYLSTVSGGGYIGGWLTRCIAAYQGDVEAVETQLNVFSKTPSEVGTLVRNKEHEPEELDTLRRYTSFLAPDPGFASIDTWANIMLWLRNMLINWTVFLPLALAAACVPAFYYALICLDGRPLLVNNYFWPISLGWSLSGLVCLFVANYNICCNLPSHAMDKPRDLNDGTRGFGLTGKDVWRKVGKWATIWTLLVPLAFAPALHLRQSKVSVHTAFWSLEAKPECPITIAKASVASCPAPAKAPAESRQQAVLKVPRLSLASTGYEVLHIDLLELLPLLSWLTCILAYVFAWGNTVSKHKAIHLRWESLQSITFRTNFFAWIVSGLIPAFSLYYGARLAFGKNALYLAILGPLWVVTGELLRATVYIAVRKRGLFSDLDREWLARINGVKLRFILMLTALSATAVLLPMIVIDHGKSVYAGLFGFSAGPIAALVGKISHTPFRAQSRKIPQKWWQKPEWVVAAASTLFAVTMFTLLGRLDTVMSVALLNERIVKGSSICSGWSFVAIVIFLGLLAIAFGMLAILIDYCVNLNLFSMHAVYRDRLTRAFLGTARTGHYKLSNAIPAAKHEPDRLPDLYTAFDPRDNMRMIHAWSEPPSPKKKRKSMFPVINVALNRTTGKGTARAERKAEPFTITPLHCGSPALDGRQGAYAETKNFAGGERVTGPKDRCRGITLGTAMTLSGAAVSPNMGYNSSPFAAFLMTLFNVRLGAWLPNPGNKFADLDLMNKSGPVLAIPTMLKELSGTSDDTGEYIYLSDGGHFDNLGLYEMLRRRCRHILVVDAGMDEKFAYFDLGRVIQMALIDFGIQVTFSPELAAGTEPTAGFAYGKIYYPKQPDKSGAGDADEPGEILYLKPYLPTDIAIELQAHSKIRTNFPHDPTTDQFFTESDFESYRRLGEVLANRMPSRMPTSFPGTEIADLFWEAKLQATNSPLRP